MDIEMHSEQRGEGRALIMLHGNGEDGSYFAAQAERFSRSFRTIALDTRGHGRTPRGTAPFTIRQFAVDLRDFMDEEGIERACILGFSDGGNIALVFGLMFPERVECLVLNGANLFFEGLVPGVRREIEQAVEQARARLGRGDESAVRDLELLALMTDDPDLDPAELSALTMPVLVVCGTDDMVSDEHSRLIAASIPGARFARIPGDHFIAAKNPQAFNDVVGEFLESVVK